MKRFVPVAVLSLALAGCGDTTSPSALADAGSTAALSSAPVRTTAPFFPVAECMDDIGFNIRFGGQRVLMTHTTTDRQGRTHTIEQFRVQDFQGWRMPVDNPPVTSADYAVQGGAEMFSTHRDAENNLIVRIHQGNLVFRDLVTGQRVIAHHTIRIVPDQEDVSFWSCRLVG
jgi:hypothetical protein